MDRLESNFNLDKGYDKELKTFVENRLREIRNNTDIENCSYFPTEFNPADLITGVGITKNFYREQIVVGRSRSFKIKERTDV